MAIVGMVLALDKSYRDAIRLRTQGHKVEFSVPHQKGSLKCARISQNLGVLGVGENIRVILRYKEKTDRNGVGIVPGPFIL